MLDMEFGAVYHRNDSVFGMMEVTTTNMRPAWSAFHGLRRAWQHGRLDSGARDFSKTNREPVDGKGNKRIAQAMPNGVPVWQPWVGLADALIFAVATVWAASRIFRVAILMQGKPPRLAEALRWALKGLMALTAHA